MPELVEPGVAGREAGAAGPAGADFIVTIDGPAASGKSSVARLVARALGVPYVSSGLLYRAATLAALRAGLDLGDEAGLLGLLEARSVRLEPDPAGNRAIIGGEDVTAQTHSSPVDAAVSRVARHPRLRDWVNRSIRALPVPFVAEGRDMGAAVFPDAPVKLYLTASPRVRAARRSGERPEDVSATLAALLERDASDEVNLRPAPGARVIDTSELSLEGVVARALEAVLNR